MFNRKLLALASLVISQQLSASEINFSGYGSLRGGALLDDDVTQVFFAYDDDELDFKSESLFAFQASTQLNEDWSATLLMQAAGKDDFDLKAQWAYVNYQMTPNTRLTFGRFALPYFRNSDTAEIGYSHNYSRLPTAVYDKRDFSVIEGVRFSHDTFIGDGDLNLKASFGAWDGALDSPVGPLSSKMDNIMQLSANYNWEWLTLFVGGFWGDWTAELDPIIDASVIGTLGLFGQSGYSISQGFLQNPAGNNVLNMGDLYLEDDVASFISAGIGIDYENILFDVEYARSGVDDSLAAIDEQYFISLGYRIDDWVVSYVHQVRDEAKGGDQTKSAAEPIVKAATDAFVEAFQGDFYFKANGLHLRYDVAPGIAYKFEYSRIHNTSADEDMDLITFGIDFVF